MCLSMDAEKLQLVVDAVSLRHECIFSEIL